MNRKAPALLALLAAASVASAAVLPAVPAGLTSIGVAAAVRGAVRASAPGQPAGRVIGSGKPVYLNDHVTTGPDGRLQVLLLDETTFTLGPNSDMVLDEFVYDPATNAGKVSAQISKGAFRFVTGKVAKRKPSDMKVVLPVGTIGIRGTMVAGEVNGRDADVVLLGPGPDNNAQERPGGITVSNLGGSSDVDAAGYGVSIRGGGAPSAGYRFTPVQLSGLLNAVASNAPPSGTGAGTGAQTAANGVGGSASQTSGQNTASGGVTFQTTASNLVAQNSDVSSFAAQQTAAASVDTLAEGGPSYWQDMINVTTGDGKFDGTGTYSCSGGVCGAGATGGFEFNLIVDFANRQIGSNGSQIIVNDTLASATTGTSIFGFSFPATSGPAAGTIPTSALNDPNFAGSSFSFKNQGGSAGQAVMKMVYSNGTESASGSVTASKQFFNGG